MNASLAKAALELQPRERLELAQLLITSVRDNLDSEQTLELSDSERLDFEDRLRVAQEQPLSGLDQAGFLESLKKHSLLQS